MAAGFLTTCSHGGVAEATTGTEIELDFSALTTGKGIQLDLDAMTTGTGIEVRADADVLTTGYFLRLLGGSAMATEVFSVGDGANTGQDVVKITGSGAHTSGYATLNVSNSAAIASDGAVLSVVGSGAIASGGNILRSEGSGTPAVGAILNEMLFSGTGTNAPVLLFLSQTGAGAALLLSHSATIECTGTGTEGMKLKNLRNWATSALSGVGRDVEIDIGGTAYYFAVRPTKA